MDKPWVQQLPVSALLVFLDIGDIVRGGAAVRSQRFACPNLCKDIAIRLGIKAFKQFPVHLQQEIQPTSSKHFGGYLFVAVKYSLDTSSV